MAKGTARRKAATRPKVRIVRLWKASVRKAMSVMFRARVLITFRGEGRIVGDIT
jgi:hypothetical protein